MLQKKRKRDGAQIVTPFTIMATMAMSSIRPTKENTQRKKKERNTVGWN